MILLGAVLFNETVDVFKDVYRYKAFMPEHGEIYFFERPEFKVFLRDEDTKFEWMNLHSPDLIYVRPCANQTFEKYSELIEAVYEWSDGFTCYLVPAVSSFREPNYYPEWLVDGKEDTCWCEGVKGAGIGQWMIYPLLVLGDEGERGIQIGFGFLNGNKKCQCNMVSKFEVEISHGFDLTSLAYCGVSEGPYYGRDPEYSNETFEMPLEPSKEWQYISFERVVNDYFEFIINSEEKDVPFPFRFWVAKLTIKSVYYGKEKEHTCLSEIRPLFKLNDKEYLTFDCHGRKIIIPANKVKVIEPSLREKDRK